MKLGIIFIAVVIISILLRLSLNKADESRMKIVKKRIIVFLFGYSFLLSYLITDTLIGFLFSILSFIVYLITYSYIRKKYSLYNELAVIILMPLFAFLSLESNNYILISYSRLILFVLTPVSIMFITLEKVDFKRTSSLIIAFFFTALLVFVPNDIVNKDNVSIQERVALEYLSDLYEHKEWRISFDQKLRGEGSKITAFNLYSKEYISLTYKNNSIIKIKVSSD